jgi:hypothetical protein
MMRLTPEERLNALLRHYQLMMELYQAGKSMRAARLDPPATIADDNSL